MVEYEDWISVAFEVADRKGFASNFDNNQELVSVAADVWRDRKQELRSASRSQAEAIAANEIHVGMAR